MVDVMRTLLLESDSIAASSLLALLTTASPPHDVRVHDTTKSALESLGREPTAFHLVLLGQPDKGDSQEALQSLKSSTAVLPPIVVLVEKPLPGGAMALLQAGAADVLCKPLRSNEVATLWQHVWRRKASSAHRSCLNTPEVSGELEASLSAQTYNLAKPNSGSRPGSSSGHSGESVHPTSASDNSSCSAVRCDVSSTAPVEPVTVGIKRSHTEHQVGGASSGLQPAAKRACRTDSKTAADSVPPSTDSAKQDNIAEVAATGSDAPSGSDNEAVNEAVPEEVILKAQLRRAAAAKAFCDSLTSLRLALKQPAVVPIQLGILPLDISPAPSSPSGDTLLRLASLASGHSTELAAARVTMKVAKGKANGGPWGTVTWAPGSAPGKVSHAQKPGSGRAASRNQQLAKSALAALDTQEKTGPEAWRANRQVAISRWRKKRAARKFTKTVRYESRRRLAAARPRVRGQFVKAVKAET